MDTPAVNKNASPLVPPRDEFAPDSYVATALAELIDRGTHATVARIMHGLDPAAMVGAFNDWWAHLAFSPGKRLRLAEKAWRKRLRFANYLVRSGSGTIKAAPMVTGGTRGIGHAVASELRDMGCRVAAVYHGNDRVAQAFKEATSIPVYKWTLQMDVAVFCCARAGRGRDRT